MRKRPTFKVPSSILHPSQERGIALILTLAIIALVTLILIAFVTSMRVENTASKSFNDLIKAREIAQGAVDQVVATIRQATTRDATILDYVTFPGVIYDYSGTPPAVAVPLYSVNAASITNLNAGYWITQTNGEFGITSPGGAAGAKFNVGWIYVLQDPSLPPGPLNPIIGRYAFWTDDEASKLNLNTAGTPSAAPVPDYGYSVSNEVDLSTLLPNPYGFVPAITLRQSSPGFTTVEEIKLADPSESDFTANQFSLTAYSNDANYPNYADDLDVLGRQRLDLALLTEAKDITDTAGPDSAYARLSDSTLTKVYSSTRAFANKYPIAGGLDGLKQIVANMIAYRLDPRLPADLAQIPDAGGADPPAYLGLARAPYVNEVKVNYDVVDTLGTIQRTVTVELFYLYGGDGSHYITGPADTIQVSSGLSTIGGLPAFTAAVPLPPFHTFNSANPYYTFQLPPETGPTLLPTTPIAIPATILTVNYLRSGKRLDCAQVPLPNTAIIGEPSISLVWQGAEVNDPCINENTTEWTPYRSPNPGTLAPAGQSGPGLPSQNSVYAPPENPPSKALIRASPMQSVGEIGYIHTPGSWTYLRLQPQPAAEKAIKQIPDWAMLDLFTIGNTTIPNLTVGRLNINSFVNPGASGPTTQRLVPLKGLLNSIVIPPPDTVAGNIYNDTRPLLAPDIYGMKDPVTGDAVFDTIGEICEAQGMDNGGATEAAKEAVIRRIGNLITVRSSTFTIWVMAQSIKQPPGSTIGTFNPGTDLIMGEVRAQAVVERYESTPGIAGSVPKFRTRYFRYLYN